ncbi:hypothetical protein [Streptomyces sp. NPDC002215]|uniref:hypothetical protein n=1 Tax=Streptomyces sp. NPDC002215 TaxID=3154412 RepID=UPI00332AA5D3
MTTRLMAVARLAEALSSALAGNWRSVPLDGTDPRELYLVDPTTGAWAIAVLDAQENKIALASVRQGQYRQQAESYIPELGQAPGLDEWLRTADLDVPAANMARSILDALDPPSAERDGDRQS